MDGQGAALLTKCPIYREDVRRSGAFEKYTKEHHASWVTFARETGHGDVNPVLVTGIDRTKDFAMLCYSNDTIDLKCDFTTSVPGGASVWGTWHKTGLVFTNRGPQSRRPPSTQLMDAILPRNEGVGVVSDGYNQCVFVRYFTVRKRLWVPRVIKGAAGPHNPGTRGSEGEGSILRVQNNSDSGSDIVSSLLDDAEDDDGSSATSVGSGSDVVVHNLPAVRYFSCLMPILIESDQPLQEEKDDFDAIADYIFQAGRTWNTRNIESLIFSIQNSNAEFALLHHRDIMLLRKVRHTATLYAGYFIFLQPGPNARLAIQLSEKHPPIVVDENGGLPPPPSASAARTHTLVSGNDHVPEGALRGYTAQCCA